MTRSIAGPHSVEPTQSPDQVKAQFLIARFRPVDSLTPWKPLLLASSASQLDTPQASAYLPGRQVSVASHMVRASVKPVPIVSIQAGAAPATVFESNRHPNGAAEAHVQPLRISRGKAMSRSVHALTREPGDRPDA